MNKLGAQCSYQVPFFPLPWDRRGRVAVAADIWDGEKDNHRRVGVGFSCDVVDSFGSAVARKF